MKKRMVGKHWSWALAGLGIAVLGGTRPASAANTITNPSFETNVGWTAVTNNSGGDHSEGYTAAWASDGSQSYVFTRSTGSAPGGSWVGISQSADLTGVSGLLFDCQDTGIDGSWVENLQFLVDGTVVGQWGNDGWPVGTSVDTGNPAYWGHATTTDNIDVPFNTSYTGIHTLVIREYTSYGYYPADTKIYDIDNIRETTGPVPEPASLGMLGLGATMLLTRRRRIT